jgi:hypothetical protein
MVIDREKTPYIDTRDFQSFVDTLSTLEKINLIESLNCIPEETFQDTLTKVMREYMVQKKQNGLVIDRDMFCYADKSDFEVFIKSLTQMERENLMDALGAVSRKRMDEWEGERDNELERAGQDGYDDGFQDGRLAGYEDGRTQGRLEGVNMELEDASKSLSMLRNSGNELKRYLDKLMDQNYSEMLKQLNELADACDFLSEGGMIKDNVKTLIKVVPNVEDEIAKIQQLMSNFEQQIKRVREHFDDAVEAAMKEKE